MALSAAALATAWAADAAAAPGWLATVEGRRVLVQRFDESSFKFEGDPLEIAQCGSWNKIGDANLAADAHGTLAYQRQLVQRGWLRWYDVTTRTLGPRLCTLDTPFEVALAPDQRHVATTMGVDNDLWLVDLEQPVPTRLTFFKPPQLGGLYSFSWLRDSERIAYALESNTTNDVVHVYSIGTSTDAALFRSASRPCARCGRCGLPCSGWLAARTAARGRCAGRGSSGTRAAGSPTS